MKKSLVAILGLLSTISLSFSLPALATTAPPPGVTVGNIVSGMNVSSPFKLQAIATTCVTGSPTKTMGYSWDSQPNAAVYIATSIDAMVTAPSLGAHTLKVKCWGGSGTSNVTNVAVNVTTGPAIPATASVFQQVQQNGNWAFKHDPATSGTSTATSELVSSPTLSGTAREFDLQFTSNGGELFSDNYGTDSTDTNWVLDEQVYISGAGAGAAGLANIEMDLNQVISDGDTTIYAFQCSGWSGLWEYTTNTGTNTSPIVTWNKSTTVCPAPKTWDTNVWHHVQIVESRDAVGNVTYQEVWLDGVQYPLVNAVGPSAFTLKWAAGALVTNFQLDGLGASGSVTAYVDNLNIYHWS